MISFDGGGSAVIVNEAGADRDFRVESDAVSHMLFVDAGSNGVGINNAAPSTTFAVNVDGAVGNLAGQNWNADSWFVISDGTAVSASGFGITHTETYGTLMASIDPFTAWRDLEMQGNEFRYMYTGNNELLTINGTEIVINETGANTDFRVESNDHAEAIFVDAFANHVIIGGSSANITNPLAYFGNVHTGSQHFALGHTAASSTAAVQYINRQSSDGVAIEFRRVNSPVGTISLTTSGTTYNTTSDRRLKTDIQPIADGTEKLMAMKPVTHTWKADPEADAVHGFIAQEMQEIVPEAVSGDPEGEDMMSMDYGRITPVLVAALQDAVKEITALKERVAELEAK